MMNKVINTAGKILLGAVFGFLLVVIIQTGIQYCSRIPISTKEQTSLLEKKIQQHVEWIQVLYDSLDQKQFTIDSLRKERARKDTIWKTKIVALNELSFSGQYEVLKSNLDTTCHVVLCKNPYEYESDTLLILNYDEIHCINETFYYRFWYEEAYASAMDELMETNNMVDVWKDVSTRQDTIISIQDSIISIQDSLIKNQIGKMSVLNKQNKTLKGGLIGTGLALLLTLVLK